MIEVGVPNFISDTWNAISAPPKTPRADRRQAQPGDQRHHQRAGHQEALRATSISRRRQPGGHGKLKDETKRWGEVIKEAGIQPE